MRGTSDRACETASPTVSFQVKMHTFQFPYFTSDIIIFTNKHKIWISKIWMLYGKSFFKKIILVGCCVTIVLNNVRLLLVYMQCPIYCIFLTKNLSYQLYRNNTRVIRILNSCPHNAFSFIYSMFNSINTVN